MRAYQPAVLAIVGITSVLGCGRSADARSASDGSWNVVVSGQSGACQGGSYQYAIQIANGIIHYPGTDARITGRVSPKGAVFVRVSTGDRSAIGSGRMSRNVGSGSFRGQSSSGSCAGVWRAQRTGG